MIDILCAQLPGLLNFGGSREIDWRIIEAGIGSQLPSDYKDLANLFPSFAVDDFLLVSMPRLGGESEFVARVVSSSYELEVDLSEGDVPDKYVTIVDGIRVASLLQWGGTPDGDAILWNTAAGSPGDWPVVFRGRSGGWWEYSEGIVGFLEGIFSGRLIVPGLPPSFRETPREVSFLSW